MHGTQVQFGHVQPAAVVRRVMQLQLGGESSGFSGGERRIERGGRVGVELIHHQHDAVDVRILDVDQVLDAAGEIEPGALRADQHGALPLERFKRQNEIDHATPDILGIMPRWATRCGQTRRPHLAQQLATRFIETDNRPCRIVRALVDGQHILPMPNELRICRGREAPLLAQVGFELVFLSVWRTVSWEMVSTTCRWTSSSASSRRLH